MQTIKEIIENQKCIFIKIPKIKTTPHPLVSRLLEDIKREELSEEQLHELIDNLNEYYINNY
ncbi:hypothetical protein DLH72_01195 [Candidatus Gracilibacteria bacterium]|nr:MAG: hypothetical protein DLH72_01195 [Candidatus Gracilibacteria bacterium]